MGGTDHAGLGIGEENRRAVGGQDAEREARHSGDHGIGLRTRIRPGFGNVHDIGRMDLVAGEQGAGAHGRGNAGPVFCHGGRIIIGARPGIEAGIDAAGNAAPLTEEAVAHALQAGKAGGGFERGRGCFGHASGVLCRAPPVKLRAGYGALPASGST